MRDVNELSHKDFCPPSVHPLLTHGIFIVVSLISQVLGRGRRGLVPWDGFAACLAGCTLVPFVGRHSGEPSSSNGFVFDEALTWECPARIARASSVLPPALRKVMVFVATDARTRAFLPVGK